MRRQRFIYSLPSYDDSSVPFESDDTSVISSHFSFPETMWSHVISPEPDGIIPFCFYPYQYFQLPTEQFSSMPGFFNPPITPINPSLAPSSLTSFDDVNNFHQEFSDAYDFTNESFNMTTPCGDGFVSENYSQLNEPFLCESVESLVQDVPSSYPMVTNYGAVTILLRHLIRVDISPARAAYVTNPPATCVAAINGMANKCCVIHPNGRVFHDGHDVHMTTLGRKAKICKRGVVFTSSDHCLSYLVDASGTKTTAEKFRDLNQDFSLEVFYDGSMAQNNVEECYRIVNESSYRSFWNGDEVWFLGGFRIKQDERGDVKVSRGRNVIRSSPTTGQVSIKIPSTEVNIGRYPGNYFLVHRGERHVTASLKGFIVQNGTQKAGFNNSSKLVLF